MGCIWHYKENFKKVKVKKKQGKAMSNNHFSQNF